MIYTESEVMQFIEENDVKFVRLAFCDIFGVQKNISILTTELEKAFLSGICIDASAIKGLMNVEETDLMLYPDPNTLAVLPWRPAQGRVVRFFCDIKYPDGTPFENDGRYILKQAVKAAKQKGYTFNVGPECEFYLFKTDEHGEPTDIPLDNAGYMDIAPPDKGENIRREICLTLEEMGIQPESSRHEQGPGQNEIDFKYSDALSAADNFITFKSVVGSIASRNGVHAVFAPKPIHSESGNGLHINMSMLRDGVNIFGSEESDSFVAGILEHISEITAFLNSTPESYKRLGEFRAPIYITWSTFNGSQLIRIPKTTGEAARMELRSPDPLTNPYIAFALLIHAALDGIDRGLKLQEPFEISLTNASPSMTASLDRLPADPDTALKLAAESALVKKVLPQKVIDAYISNNKGFM